MKRQLVAALLSLALLTLTPLQAFAASPVRTETTGQTTSRNYTTSLDYSAVFDADYYYRTYPDLQKNIGHDKAALLNHFVTVGMKEGRSGNAAFQVKAYMYNNLDLLPIYGVKDLSAYYIHYITAGQAEGRKAVFDPEDTYPEGALASFSTAYDATEERAVNVELAAARINGLTLQAGESFSFDQSVGTRTTKNGYVVAPSYASGRVVTSVGGGICQVSSTLYVTMLLSGIPATRHYFHSLPVDYVPEGLDAAIVEGYKDLRFTNPFDYPITILASAGDGTVTVTIMKTES